MTILNLIQSYWPFLSIKLKQVNTYSWRFQGILHKKNHLKFIYTERKRTWKWNFFLWSLSLLKVNIKFTTNPSGTLKAHSQRVKAKIFFDVYRFVFDLFRFRLRGCSVWSSLKAVFCFSTAEPDVSDVQEAQDSVDHLQRWRCRRFAILHRVSQREIQYVLRSFCINRIPKLAMQTLNNAFHWSRWQSCSRLCLVQLKYPMAVNGASGRNSLWRTFVLAAGNPMALLNAL